MFDFNGIRERGLIGVVMLVNMMEMVVVVVMMMAVMMFEIT